MDNIVPLNYLKLGFKYINTTLEQTYTYYFRLNELRELLQKYEVLEPINPHIPLQQNKFLGAHNAYSHPPLYLYYQQLLSLEEQFQLGARMFQLDTEERNGEVITAHGSSGFGTSLFTIGTKAFRPSAYESIVSILSRLEKLSRQDNVNNVLFLGFEDRVGNMEKLDKTLEQVPEFLNKVLTKQDWQMENHNYNFPSLKQMNEMGKKFILFIQSGGKVPSLYFYAKPLYVKEYFRQERRYPEYDDQRKFFLFNYQINKITDSLSTAKQNFKLHNFKKELRHISEEETVINLDRLEALLKLRQDNQKNIIDYINQENHRKKQI